MKINKGFSSAYFMIEVNVDETSYSGLSFNCLEGEVFTRIDKEELEKIEKITSEMRKLLEGKRKIKDA